jgi:hypothetical protein
MSTPNADGTGPAAGRLRLSEILAQLDADAGGAAADADSNITIGEIIDRTTHAGFAFLAALLALVSIPFVGLSTPFGLAIGFGAGQMIAGRSRPWLPKRVRANRVSAKTLRWVSQKVSRWTSGLERLVRPRWTFLARGPFYSLIGVGILIQGIGLALPIPLPGSNLVFVVPILVYSIGLLEDDGWLILAGHAITAAELVLGVFFSHLIVQGIEGAVNGIRGLFG